MWGTPTVNPARSPSATAPRRRPTVTNTYVRQFGSLIDHQGGQRETATPAARRCRLHRRLRLRLRLHRLGHARPRVAARPCPACRPEHLHGAGGPAGPGLLAPAYIWGTPTWSPEPSRDHRRRRHRRRADRHQPHRGGLRPGQRHQGGHRRDPGRRGGAPSTSSSPAPAASATRSTSASAAPASRPDLPVGTSCTITETPPSGGLIDASYAWGPTPPAQTVTITSSGQVVAVTVTNTVVRVHAAADHHQGADRSAARWSTRRGRSRSSYSCLYGNDPAVTGTVHVDRRRRRHGRRPPPRLALHDRRGPGHAGRPAGARTTPRGCGCRPTVDPTEAVVVDSATTPAAVTVTNTIRQLTRGFSVTKTVIGEGKEGGYTPGATFGFTLRLRRRPAPVTFSARRRRDVRTSRRSRRHRRARSPRRPAARRPRRPSAGTTVEFTASAGRSRPAVGDVHDPQRPGRRPGQRDQPDHAAVRLGPGDQDGHRRDRRPRRHAAVPDHPRLRARPRLPPVTCRPTATLTQDNIPVGSTCTAAETRRPAACVDASYAWGTPTFTPADATVTVAVGATVDGGQCRTRSCGSPRRCELVKTFTGPQGVIDPARTYPITWSCTYGGASVGRRHGRTSSPVPPGSRWPPTSR